MTRPIDWVPIPAGPFSHKKGSRSLDYDYEIARHPVTHAQFEAFVNAEDGLPGTVHDWVAGLTMTDADRPLKAQANPQADHPRENVNWFQAVAFCRWMSWKEGGGFDLARIADWTVRLPTELEWEKAARGTTKGAFPYGAEFDPTKANGRDTGLGTTSPVDAFPGGASPYGVLDMSGNVWEWSLSDHAEPKDDATQEDLGAVGPRLIKGGCFGNAPGHMKVSYRGKALPRTVLEILGFRVCRSGGR
jgi:formylglycine-generating enzyme required for sulfatase activity